MKEMMSKKRGQKEKEEEEEEGKRGRMEEKDQLYLLWENYHRVSGRILTPLWWEAVPALQEGGVYGKGKAERESEGYLSLYQEKRVNYVCVGVTFQSVAWAVDRVMTSFAN